MQVAILNGIYSDKVSDLRTSYPVNMVPVPKESGISAGYLKPAEGSVRDGYGIGLPRGGINWDGSCYRVMGTKLVKIGESGALTVIGDVGDGGRCTFDYSHDRLAVASGGRLYYYDGETLTEVVDTDLGAVVSFCWVDGYFMTTDGFSLVVTELSNPEQVDPLKYGSSEADPDLIVAVLKLRNEVHCVNRHTIEVFDNVGGGTFPFSRITGAQIQKGAVGTHAACVFSESIAFLGGGRNEPPAVYLGRNAEAAKVSTREIDKILQGYDESELAAAVLESRSNAGHDNLMVRLPDRTLVYDLAASQELKAHVWYQLTSSTLGFLRYRAVDHVWCYGQWLVCDADTGDYGHLTEETARHFGEVVRWEFGTSMLYNGGLGAVVNQIELVCVAGRAEQGETPHVETSYSNDGVMWSQDRTVEAGVQGDRLKRMVWMRQGVLRNWRVQRFSGDSKSQLSVSRLEMAVEPLQA